MIDFAKEADKLKDKRLKIDGQMQTLKKNIAKGDYEAKVPEHIREQNKERVCYNINFYVFCIHYFDLTSSYAD